MKIHNHSWAIIACVALMLGVAVAAAWSLYANSDYYETPLISAIISNNPVEVRKYSVDRKMINRKQTVSGDDQHKDWTPIMWAVESGDAAIVSIVVESGADVSAVDGLGRTSARIIFDVHEPATATRLLSALLKNPSTVRTVGKDGETPLYYAIRQRNRDAVAALLMAGADPNAGSRNGVSPLFVAIASKCEAEIVSLLVDGGANVSVVSPSGRNVLEVAIATGCDGKMLEILRRGLREKTK